MPKLRRFKIIEFLAIIVLSWSSVLQTQPAHMDAVEAGEDWRTYHGNPGATHYSRLSQISADNVKHLQVAWSYNSGDSLPADMESNPLIVRGRLVFVSPTGRIICLDAKTGKERWTFDAEPDSTAQRERSRGVAYWSDGREERILFTFRHYLLAIDFDTGKLIRSFGSDGRVDLREGLGRDIEQLSVANVTPGAIYRDLLIMGSTGNTPGHVRAFDVRSGKIIWTFHTIPFPGEPGYETWPPDAWQRSNGANVWAGITVDEQAGTVFLPIASGGMGPKDFYGADRLGDNLYANCLVALDAATGKLRWHFQTVRHDLWDRDLPAQPTLVVVRRNGKEIPAIAQVTKSGFLFVLDRDTGALLYEVEDKAVPPSDVPGEVAAKTQIIPKEPKPFARQQLTADLLTRRTPEAYLDVARRFAEYRSSGQFEPPSLQGSIIFPGLDGGAEYGGAAYDPQSGLLYVNSNEMAWILKLQPYSQNTGLSPGRRLYLDYCAMCHGAELRGSPPEFPSLLEIRSRLSEKQIQTKIQSGGGRMPTFGSLAPEEMTTLVKYLVNGDGSTGSVTTALVHSAEIEKNSHDRYVFAGYTKFLDPDGYPAITPPWGTLTAIDVSTGQHAWSIPLGEYPELAAKGLKDTGSENYGGAVVTAGGLLFIGATVYDDKFRAFDKRTGQLLWETRLPAAGLGTPSTYMVDGRQYVVIAAGGGKNYKGNYGGFIVAFALPEN